MIDYSGFPQDQPLNLSHEPLDFRVASANALGLKWRWLIWWLYLFAWSTALLTPHPVLLARAFLADYAFLAAKMLHVTAYALFAILSGWLRVSHRHRWFLLLLLAAHAGGTEFLQGLLPYRTSSWRDVGLNCLGLGLGVLVSWKWWFVRTAGRDAGGPQVKRPGSPPSENGSLECVI